MDDNGSFRLLFYSQLKIIEDKSGFKGSYIAGILGLCTFLVFFGIFDYYLANLVGIVFPILWSLKSLQSRGEDDDKQWLTYWIIFSSTHVIDVFSDYILQIIPFYFFIKIVFLIWMFLPNFRGAEVIYHYFIKKYFKKYLDDIDKLTKNTNTATTTTNNNTKSSDEIKKDEFSKSAITPNITKKLE